MEFRIMKRYVRLDKPDQYEPSPVRNVLKRAIHRVCIPRRIENDRELALIGCQNPLDRIMQSVNDRIRLRPCLTE